MTFLQLCIRHFPIFEDTSASKTFARFSDWGGLLKTSNMPVLASKPLGNTYGHIKSPEEDS